MSDLTQILLTAKQEKGLTFAQLGQELGRDPLWVASLLHRQATASAQEAEQLATALGLDLSVVKGLMAYPVKGSLNPVIPTDPLIYRFYEIMQVYGMPLKDLIQEEFGDGIMSAIDFEMAVERVEDPKGDRVKITMNGKFLPYKKW
ncbi:MAG: cyanase [Thermosynechococcaceae cyanobacterium MS004]|nr:cyanase [Thermosynechococcaceae cyanobacterium MS004]